MSLITIASEKCKRDGICVASCPLGLIEIKDKLSVPEPVFGADEKCLNCGHCVSVCPHDALSLVTMKQNELLPVQKSSLPNPEQIEHLMRSRRSIRAYKKKQVKRETITKLIDIARYAPTGHNTQSVGWMVIDDKEEIRRLAGIIIDWFKNLIKEQSPMAQQFSLDSFVSAWEAGNDMVLRDASAIVITHAPKAYGAAEINNTIALTYFELAASTFGIGTCWAGVINLAVNQWEPFQQALGIPKTDTCLAMMVGYPKFKYHKIPMRNKAKIEWR